MPLIIVSASVGPVTKVARLTEVSVNIILPIKSAKRLLDKCYLRFRITAFIRDPFCLKQFSFVRSYGGRTKSTPWKRLLPQPRCRSYRQFPTTNPSPLKDVAFSNIYRCILLFIVKIFLDHDRLQWDYKSFSTIVSYSCVTLDQNESWWVKQ